MIQTGISGKQYTLNGVPVAPKDFRGVSLFKFVNHIVAWIDGGAHGLGGGVHLSNAKKTLEREVVGLGFKRARTPVELMLWGPPYFDLSVDAPEPWRGWSNVANTLALVNLRSGVGSAYSMTPKMKKTIRMMVLLAREFDIILEVPWVWTIKSVSDGYSNRRLGLDEDPRLRYTSARPKQGGVGIWNEHYLAAHGIGAYLHLLKTQGDGDGEHRVDAGPLNLLHDLKNERTAHVGDPDPSKTNEWDSVQLGAIAQRWKTRDAIGELCEISESGNITYGAPLASSEGAQGYDAVTVHPPRDGEWIKAPLRYREKWPNELLDYNESQMLWTSAQRKAWVGLIPKWEGLGSTDIDAVLAMYETMETVGGYVTAHTLRGMDGGWPETPQTEVEDALREYNGGTGRPPPPDPPVPPPPPAEGMMVVSGANFRWLSSLDFPHVVDVQEDGDEPWQREYRVTLGAQPFGVAAVDFFFGHDRGDRFEMDVTIWGDAYEREHMRYFVARRVEEQTAPSGEASILVHLPAPLMLRYIKVLVLCRITGANSGVHAAHPSYKTWRGNFDLNIGLIGGG